MDVHLEEQNKPQIPKIFSHMWVVQMEREVRKDNLIAQKLLDIVKDLDKRQGIIDDLKVEKGMRAWKAVTFLKELEHRKFEMRHQLMMQIN
ncbi:hypothetical protein Tco_0294046 [Tanacetum coccineum]